VADILFPDVARGVNYDVGTAYDLYFKFKDQTLNSNYAGVGITCPNATVGAITSVDGNNKYKFKLTPTTASTNQITVTNARDINSFIYPSFSSLSNLVFNAVQYSIIIDASLASKDASNYVTNWNVANTSMVVGGVGTTIPYMTYQPNNLNGLPTVKFNNSTAWSMNRINIPVTQFSTNYEIFFVVKFNANINVANGLMFNTSNNNNIGVYHADGNCKLLNSSSKQCADFNVASRIGTWMIIKSSFRSANGDSSITYIINGAETRFQSYSTFASGIKPTYFSIGSYPATGHGLDIDLAECRIYDGIMDSAQQSAIVTQLRNKWAV
jgi:hypothetical protein